MSLSQKRLQKLALSIKLASGAYMDLTPNRITLSSDNSETIVTIHVTSPKLFGIRFIDCYSERPSRQVELGRCLAILKKMGIHAA